MQGEQKIKNGKFQQLHKQLDQKKKNVWESQQLKIRNLIIQKDDFNWTPQTLKLVAGVDLSASKKSPNLACAGLVIFDISTDQVVYQDYQIIEINQPYIPGFLAFREIPPLYQLFMRLKAQSPQHWPQLLMVDGNGILHSHQCGLASHLGVLLNMPSIGIGKTLFYIDGLDKQSVKEQCLKQIDKQGSFSILIGKSGRKWGAGLRMTQQSVNPVFVSIGHRISLQTAIKCVLKVSKHRVPQPIRIADKKTRKCIDSYVLDIDYPPFKYAMKLIE